MIILVVNVARSSISGCSGHRVRILIVLRLVAQVVACVGLVLGDPRAIYRYPFIIIVVPSKIRGTILVFLITIWMRNSKSNFGHFDLCFLELPILRLEHGASIPNIS